MKNERYMHVSSVFQQERNVPYIRLRGKWLEEAGFEISKPIKVIVDNGSLKITNNQKENPQSLEGMLTKEKSSNSLEEIVNESCPLELKPSHFNKDYQGYTIGLKLVRNSTYEPLQLNSDKDVYYFLKSLQNESREVMLSTMLDAKNQVIGVYEVSKGSVISAAVSPREILKSALMSNSNSIILAHNHPSGDCEPSREDICLTEKIAQASDLVQIKLLDHIIIGYNSYCSLRDLGHIGK